MFVTCPVGCPHRGRPGVTFTTVSPKADCDKAEGPDKGPEKAEGPGNAPRHPLPLNRERHPWLAQRGLRHRSVSPPPDKGKVVKMAPTDLWRRRPPISSGRCGRVRRAPEVAAGLGRPRPLCDGDLGSAGAGSNSGDNRLRRSPPIAPCADSRRDTS